MMNKHTRKLSKMLDEVRSEIGPYFLERTVVIDEDSRKLQKLNDDTTHRVRKGLTPHWGDVDVNQHVNIVKYIGWILEDGNEVFFRIKRSTQLKKLMNAYCDRQSVDFNSIAFLFDGRRLRGEQTPDELEMEDGDEIDAMLHQTGGSIAN